MSTLSTEPFKKQHTADKRKAEAARIRAKYPDRIPVIAERSLRETVLADIDKKKYLVPGDLTVGQFIYVLRKRIKLTPEKALYVFFNGKTLPPSAALMSQIYKDHKDDDGFLYCQFTGEATFGV